VQLLQLRKFAELRDWKVSGEYIDTCSGKTPNRPGLKLLKSDAKSGSFNAKLEKIGDNMSLLEIARNQMRDGMQIGVDRRNAKLRAKGSAKRCYLDERGKMQLRTLSAEELAEEREIYGE